MASTTYEQTPRYYYDQRSYPILFPALCDHFAAVGKMRHYRAVTVRARNAGQFQQPFWIGAACGGGSRGAARCAART